MTSRTGNKLDTRDLMLDARKLRESSIKYQGSRRGFTLVELMISVVILGFGLAVIIQSYISSLSGLNSTGNVIESMRLAKEKAAELELSAYENKGLTAGENSGETILGSRKFRWITQVSELSEPAYLSNDTVMATVTLDWQERNIPKTSLLAAYFPKRNETQKDKVDPGS